jgi:hypothetical protein
MQRKLHGYSKTGTRGVGGSGVICDFCGYLGQVKSVTVIDINTCSFFIVGKICTDFKVYARKLPLSREMAINLQSFGSES